MSNEKSMANILLNPWQPFLSSTSFKPPKKDKMSDHGRAKAASGSRNRLESKNIVNRTSSFNYRSSSAVPLHELPWASFDQYIEDKGRVIRSIFPEKSASQLLNREEWRVKMTPIQVLFLTCQPVAHITAKCISEADDYPPEIPGHITKFFEIQIVLENYAEDINNGFAVGLLADYNSFKRNKARYSV
ncbi:hypothetical protein GLYMA_13G061800v4 [Glycine max]|nr:hypothetical protein GLYMA_13G061800v4 [Glycine max]|eukprot:XP_014621022.1 uncharacterized protein LOC102667583 isoform X2 [Glycine max]